MRAPTVAAITLNPTGGGIAVVSNLLWRVVRDQWGPAARLLTMFDHESRPATFAEKARYTTALMSAQAFGRTDWILFSHLALAKIQTAVPLRLRRPYGVFLHGIEAWNGLTPVEKETLSQARIRVANSTYTAARITQAHPDIGPIEACPLALPPPTISDRIDDAPGRLGPHAVLSVGRMNRSERYKGHDQLIDAWPAVVDTIQDAQLVFVGDGDDAGRLMEKASASRAARNIQFMGYVSSATLDALYRSVALFALPSRAEGFGLVYLEAMAHRLACIGSIHDAAGEVIVDGQTGQLVNQDDRESLATTVSNLLLDEQRRQRMGEAGYRRLLSEFSFDRFRARISTLLYADRPAPVRAIV